MKYDVRYFKAMGALGMALARHLTFAPFVPRRGPQGWLGRILQEDLGPTPEGAWDTIESTSRCIGCGICDGVDIGDASPSSTLLGIARQPSDAPLSLKRAAKLKAVAREIEEICPARVSVEEIVRLVEANAAPLHRRPGANR